MTLEVEGAQVVQRRFRLAGVDRAVAHETAERAGRFDVEQMRRMDAQGRIADEHADAPPRRRIEQQFDDRGRVEHNHLGVALLTNDVCSLASQLAWCRSAQAGQHFLASRTIQRLADLAEDVGHAFDGHRFIMSRRVRPRSPSSDSRTAVAVE